MRVLMVEDHELFAEAIGPPLKATGLDVIGFVTTGAEAIETVRRERPDAVLVDLGLPDVGGIEVGRRILAEFPETNVVAVTSVIDPDTVAETMRAGFNGYITKDVSLSQFITSIEAALNGQSVMPHRTARAVAGAVSPEEENAVLRIRQLTARERDVLTLLVRGTSSGAIARELSVSINTVRSHVQNILAKLQVHSRLEAAAFAVRYGAVKVQDRPVEATAHTR
jgi:two-component system, NarL family, nitrate/nitrite response regulator NarL